MHKNTHRQRNDTQSKKWNAQPLLNVILKSPDIIVYVTIPASKNQSPIGSITYSKILGWKLSHAVFLEVS